jgi:pimeloyl-ACP methyl ester carboxylesterase
MQTFKGHQGTLAYCDNGHGETLVFCHGTPSSSVEFAPCLKELRLRGLDLRFLALDHLGFGASQKPPKAKYTLSTHLERFSEWLDWLSVPSVHLVVHDFGGPIALPWAIRNLSKVRSLTLINTWFWPFEWVDPSFESQKKILRSRWVKFLYLSLNVSPRFLVKMAWGKHAPFTHEDRAQFVAPFPKKADRTALYAMVEALVDSKDFWQTNSVETLQALKSVPTSVVWGNRDPLIKPMHLAEWQKRLPHAHVKELTDVGHFPLLEAPKETAEIIYNNIQRGIQCAQ